MKARNWLCREQDLQAASFCSEGQEWRLELLPVRHRQEAAGIRFFSSLIWLFGLQDGQAVHTADPVSISPQGQTANVVSRWRLSKSREDVDSFFSELASGKPRGWCTQRYQLPRNPIAGISCSVFHKPSAFRTLKITWIVNSELRDDYICTSYYSALLYKLINITEY